MFNVLSIGKSNWKKGYGYALDAFKLLKEQNVKFTYTILGGINLELKFQIVELGLENDVLVIDQLPFNEFRDVLKTADLVLLASVKEENANSVLQAMTLQKLVLITNCEGLEKVIVNDENGFVIPIRDVEAMSKKMYEISQMSESQKNKITTKALEILQQQHTEVQLDSAMANLYQSL